MQKLTWRNLSDEVMALVDLIDESVDADTGEIHDADTLQQLEDDLKDKLTKKGGSIIEVIRFQEDELTSITNEIARLTKLKASMQKKNSNFKEYIRYNMEKMGVNKVETPNGILSLRKSTVCLITDEGKIPDEYTDTKITTTVSKTKVKDALKRGEIIDGAKLEEKLNLNVK